MSKFIAIVRTVCLVLLVGYLLWSLPLALMSSSEAKAGTISVNLSVVEKVAGAAWLAVAWIALETAASWVRVWMAGRKKASAMTAAEKTRSAV